MVALLAGSSPRGAVRRWVSALALLGAVTASACGDDIATIPMCDDGYADPGALCFHGRVHVYTPALEPHALRVADYDGDGNGDVLVIGLDPGVAAELRLGRGAVAEGDVLAPPHDPGLHGCSAHPVQARLRRDALTTDVLFATCEPRLQLFTNETAEHFAHTADFELAGVPITTAIEDLDGDGNLDIAALVSAGDGVTRLSVLLGDGARGTLARVDSDIADAADFAPRAFAVADLDGDGRGDAVLLDRERGALRVAFGTGGGAIETPRPLELGPATTSLAAADLDDDGAAELLAGDDELRAVSVHTFDPRRVPTATGGVELPDPAERPGTLVLTDLDGDDDLDVALTTREGPDDDPRDGARVWLAQNRGDGRFTHPVVIDFGEPVEQIGFTDINDDGAPDLVAGTFESGTLTLRMANP